MTFSQRGHFRDLSDRFSVYVYMFISGFLVLFLDRFTKSIVVSNLYEGQSLNVFPNIFHITLIFNNGTAFGLFKGSNAFFLTFLSFLVICFIIIYTWKSKTANTDLYLALGLILGGASGNLIDRLKFGYVIDFLDFRIWPVFNMADSFITVGAVILISGVLFNRRKR